MYLSTCSTWRRRKNSIFGGDFTTSSTCTGKEPSPKSMTNSRQENHRQQQAKEPSQLQGRVETQTNQLFAEEHIKEGRDRRASASHEPKESPEPRCNDPVPRSGSTQSSPPSLRRAWRQVANKSSKWTDDVTGHVSKTEENAQSARV